MKMIIEDSRQKTGKHRTKHEYWEEHGIDIARCALPYADYWPTPRVAVDTKQNIQEIGANLCGAAKERRRFTEECKKAKADECKLIILIEDRRYHEIADLYGTSIYLLNGQTISGDQLATSMHIMEGRYGCEFWFCDPEESGRVITELLEDGYG